MPLDSSVFPEEVQVAFFIFNLLSDNWEGMSGTYLGKDWSNIIEIFKLHGIDNQIDIFFYTKLYEDVVVGYRSQEQQKKQKAAERKAKAGGKNFRHNVKG